MRLKKGKIIERLFDDHYDAMIKKNMAKNSDDKKEE